MINARNRRTESIGESEICTSTISLALAIRPVSLVLAHQIKSALRVQQADFWTKRVKRATSVPIWPVTVKKIRWKHRKKLLVKFLISIGQKNQIYHAYKKLKLTSLSVSNNKKVCSYQCATCVTNSTNCITCTYNGQNRSAVPSCLCKTGYFEIYQNACPQCGVLCAKCVGFMDNCTQCAVR